LSNVFSLIVKKTLLSFIAILPYCFVPASLADGVCEQSGWCKLHLTLRSQPNSTVFIKPVGVYGPVGQFRQVLISADGNMFEVTINCANGSLAERRGPFYPISPNTVGQEIFESVCLNLNQAAFPTSPRQTPLPWPSQPPSSLNQPGFSPSPQPVPEAGPQEAPQAGPPPAGRPAPAGAAPSVLKTILDMLVK